MRVTRTAQVDPIAAESAFIWISVRIASKEEQGDLVEGTAVIGPREQVAVKSLRVS